MTHFISRRIFGAACASVVLAAPKSIFTSPLQAADSTKLLLGTGKESPAIREIKAEIEIAGQLKLNPDGKEVRKVPIDVAGSLQYEERAVAAKAPQGLRYYFDGQTHITLGKTKFDGVLRDEHRYIAVGTPESAGEVYSLAGPLSRDELEALHGLVNTLVIHELLPQREIAVSESWEIADEALARLFNLDVVHKSEIRGTLKSIESDVAILYYEGLLQGSISGIATEIDLKAKANFDRTARHLNWLNMAYKETRDIGHAEPGYEAVFKMKIANSAKATSKQLSDTAIAKLNWKDEAITDLEFQAAKAPFRTVIGRRWRVMTDDEQTTIVRMIDGSDLIAQGNIAILHNAPSGKSLGLEEFQQEVENALGENFQEFVEASQGVNERGCRMLRVVAIGMSNELSIQWNYYHLSNSEGRQAAMVFTCESDLVERMRDQDRAIAMSFEFTAPIETALAKTKPEQSDSASKNTETVADKKPGEDLTNGSSQLAAEASPSDLDSTAAGQGKTIGNLAIPKPNAGAKTTGPSVGKSKSGPAGKAAARGSANAGSKKSKR